MIEAKDVQTAHAQAQALLRAVEQREGYREAQQRLVVALRAVKESRERVFADHEVSHADAVWRALAERRREESVAQTRADSRRVLGLNRVPQALIDELLPELLP